jgi:predicted dehydrogenase
VNRKLSVGIIGAGGVVRERHLPALAAQDGVRVAWVCDPVSEAAERVAAICKGDVRTASAPDSRLAATDIVLVATPPAAHADQIVRALDAGCHVLCEKPLALDPGDCQRVVETAREVDRVASVAFNLRHHTAAAALRSAYRAGDLGRAVAVRTCTVAPERSGGGAWLGDGAAGGDVLWEVGSHHVDLWRFLLDSDVVEATGQVRDQVAVISARMADGTPVSATIGWGAGPKNEIEVIGDRARGVADLFAADPMAVTRVGRTGSELGERLRATARSARALPSLARAAFRGGAFQATYSTEWSAFLDAVRGVADNPCPVEDGLAACEGVRLLRAGCGLVDETAGAPA